MRNGIVLGVALSAGANRRNGTGADLCDDAPRNSTTPWRSTAPILPFRRSRDVGSVTDREGYTP